MLWRWWQCNDALLMIYLFSTNVSVDKQLPREQSGCRIRWCRCLFCAFALSPLLPDSRPLSPPRRRRWWWWWCFVPPPSPRLQTEPTKLSTRLLPPPVSPAAFFAIWGSLPLSGGNVRRRLVKNSHPSASLICFTLAVHLLNIEPSERSARQSRQSPGNRTFFFSSLEIGEARLWSIRLPPPRKGPISLFF